MSEASKNHATAEGRPGKLSVPRSILLATVVGFGVVSFWRGVWYLWDVFTLPGEEHRLWSGLASMLTGIAILAAMRTFYSVLAPPLQRMNIR